MVPEDLRGRVEPAQMFHEILEHRWYLGEKAGKDLGITFAAEDYIKSILPFRNIPKLEEEAVVVDEFTA
jgi:Domain of unknown function (DUF4032)